MRQRHVRVIAAHFNDHIAPQLRCFQDIHLVHGAELAAALPGRLESDVGNAADFRFTVDHGVETYALAVADLDAARFAEIDVAGELADDQNVHARDNLRPQAGSAGQFRIQHGRTQISEGVERLAQAEQRPLRPLVARQRIVLGTADGAEQHSV